MAYRSHQRAGVWSALIAVLLLWWIIALYTPKTSADLTGAPASHPTEHISSLSVFDRQEILNALQGNEQLMRDCIARWRSEIADIAPEQLPAEPTQNHPRIVEDDASRSIDLTQDRQRILPQTYASATILLAILEPEHIVAIPSGLRQQEHLFAPGTLESIPLDTDRFNSEEIQNAQPDLAFVAHYSLPSTCRTLERQGIQLFSLDQINTPSEICGAIRRVGLVIGKPERSNLLASFVEHALARIDVERQQAERRLDSTDHPRILYVNWFGELSLPSSRTLSGQLLERLNIATSTQLSDDHNDRSWSKKISIEEIAAYNPDAIIVCAPSEHAQLRLAGHPGLAHTRAVQNHAVYRVDDAVHSSPSQYIVIAYLDMCDVLMNTLAASPA